jgi:hypothetical protein
MNHKHSMYQLLTGRGSTPAAVPPVGQSATSGLLRRVATCGGWVGGGVGWGGRLGGGSWGGGSWGGGGAAGTPSGPCLDVSSQQHNTAVPHYYRCHCITLHHVQQVQGYDVTDVVLPDPSPATLPP